jgi:hypothetical protein
MASRAALASQMEQPNPPINEHLGGASPKNQPTPRVGSGALCSWPNEGLHPSLGALPLPRSMIAEVWPQKASLRGSGPVIAALRMAWSFG